MVPISFHTLTLHLSSPSCHGGRLSSPLSRHNSAVTAQQLRTKKKKNKKKKPISRSSRAGLQERIKAIIEDDPSSARLDIDHDPVYQVCGKDKYGSVRGYGVGVSKTSLVSSATAKEQLQLERQSRTILENQVNTLQQQVLTRTDVVMELKEEVASLRTQRNVNNSATSKVRGSQSYFETQSREGMEMCELLNLQREVIDTEKATRGNTFFIDDEDEPMEMYKVRVVVIFDKKERLFGSKGNFADIRPPAVVCWPKCFTRFVSQTVAGLS